MRRLFRRAARAAAYALVALIAIAALLLAAIETRWGKQFLLRAAVAQGNRYLDATLEIGQLGGSLLRGIDIRDVRLVRNGEAVVTIERVELDYTLAALMGVGTTIERLTLTRPQVIGRREPDGRWNLSALEPRPRTSTGPPRAITILKVEVENGSVALRDPLRLGAFHVPGRYDRLQAELEVRRTSTGAWTTTFTRASWLGGATDLAVDALSGGIGNGPEGWKFNELAVQTAQSALRVDGKTVRGNPTTLDLGIQAERFNFQEWGRVLPALERIPVDAGFNARLRGPLAALAVDLDSQSNGGAARGPVVLDTTVPGWHGAGTLDLTKLDLAPWFNNPAQRSDITGKVEFDVALRLGQGVPIGTYRFAGPHASYAGYEGSRIDVRGDITEDAWRIAQGTAAAYGGTLSLSSGSIQLKTPHDCRFKGHTAGVDLRALPDSVPVPHVESLLTMDFDAECRFTEPLISATATFGESQFIGATIAAGSTGLVHSAFKNYGGDGHLSGVDINRWGRELGVEWMQQPRYEGTLTGRFRGEWLGLGRPQLDASGHVESATLFGGRLHDGDVTLAIYDGNVDGSYDGAFEKVNPSILLADDRYDASLTGTGQIMVTVDDLMERDTTLDDYTIRAPRLSLQASRIRDVDVTTATVDTTFSGSSHQLDFATFHVTGPLFDAEGKGFISTVETSPSELSYNIHSADLTLLKEFVGDVTGSITTAGRLVGPLSALNATGDATVTNATVAGVTVASTTGKYDVTFPWETPSAVAGEFNGSAETIEAFGQMIASATGTARYDNRRISADLAIKKDDTLNGTVTGTATLHPGERAIDVDALKLATGSLAWQLRPSTPSPVVRWDDAAVTLDPMTFVDSGAGDQRVELSGTWRDDGNGQLKVVGRAVSLDALTSAPDRPATYGGRLDIDAVVSGTVERPVVKSQLTVHDGRIRRVAYEKLAGTVNYDADSIDVDLRLDQAANVWMTAKGHLPLYLVEATAPDGPIDLVVTSSDVGLGLVEGITTLVREVSGTVRGTVHVTGTGKAPVVAGNIDVTGAAFQVTASGVRYRNGRAAMELSADRLNVTAFHLEDRNGRVLDVRGNVATRELRLGEVEVDITARGFEVVRNAIGDINVNANLKLRGTVEAPRLFGDVTIASGELRVDEVLARSLFQPYAIGEPATATDALSAFNPWDRLSLEVTVYSQNQLRMTGENLAVSESAPLGLGSFNLRASGDIFLYKEPGEPISITGSLDSISGSYAFQGRRFELFPSSSVEFQGDLNPSLYVSVNRVISGVETRVTISGTLAEPELRLSSNPPLDQSDILSLIVFNSSTNELSTGQQRELAVRAGALAVGFVTSSLTSALQRTTGLDILEIEPVTGADAPKVTIGAELAPGLTARFSRQFGTEAYDEAVLDYYISRLFRIRATFSDVSSLGRSPFRRVERTGIDLLLMLSF